MPKPKDPSDNPRHEHYPEGPPDSGKDHPRPRRHRNGRDRIVHVAITERRFAGGPPPTHEAYNNALEQWHKLPGAVVRPPTDIRLKAQPATAAGEDANTYFPWGVGKNEEPKQ